ncbi:MAG: tRNA (guanosine(46)-N7)-methyltransferase TrmB [Bacteroidia bacterium]|nr:tRNA (guanosine(46)-N7)-methyltransferase TrmB [Bacteroidia bacterium]
MPTKLEKFSQFKKFNNAFTYLYQDYILDTQPFHLFNQWNVHFFHNNHPIILEIGCGRGEYTVGLASKYPHQNFIGIDYKSNRMWMGAKYALENQLKNVAFIRTKVEFLDKVFAPLEISEIWITFPDPQIQKSREKKRLTHPRFLEHYKKFLKKNGIIHLKTDNDIFFNYTLETLKNLNITPLLYTYNLYQEKDNTELNEVKSIQTYYEKLFSEQGHSIKYCKFQLI